MDVTDLMCVVGYDAMEPCCSFMAQTDMTHSSQVRVIVQKDMTLKDWWSPMRGEHACR